MEKKLTDVLWGKHWDTDIDTLTIFLDDTNEQSVVNEFEVSEDEKYMILYSETEDKKILNWIEIINPNDFIISENASMPDVTITYNDKNYNLREITVKLTEEKGN